MVLMERSNRYSAVTSHRISEANLLAMVSHHAPKILDQPFDFRGEKSFQGLPSMKGLCT